jgi:Bifunctional DNA primase/polymerase, N-terminal
MTANAESALVAAALDYIARGWSPIPIPHREKGPLIGAWQDLRVTPETATAYFSGAKQNIGIILGKASGGLTDLDLDCPEAIAAAPYILPRTAVFGRATKPASHWVYRANLHETKDRAAIKFMSSDKTGLLEVRMGAGGLASQTVFPPSTHVSGEPIEWAGKGASEIAEVDGDELIQRARRLAAASELARSYPKIGGRHDAAFVLGSFLSRCGFSQPGAATFVEAVAAASLQPSDKRRDMARTARDGAAAGKLAGFPLLAETFGEGAAKKVVDWLDYAGEREGRGALPEATTAASASWGDAEQEIVAKLAEGDSAGFLARAKADVGFPFEPQAIAALNQLAKRRAPNFERLRTQLKGETKVRFAALEAAMRAEAAISDSGEDGLPGRPITFEEIEPWREPVDGDALLTELSETIGAYVIMEPGQRDACARPRFTRHLAAAGYQIARHAQRQDEAR